MIAIIGKIQPDNPELFTLEFGKIAVYDIVKPTSPKLGQNVCDHVRSQMCLIMDLIRP